MVRVVRRVAAVVASLWCVWLLAGREIDRSPWMTVLAQIPTTAPACGANPVVCENQQIGDGDFDLLNAAGDPLIEGFATDISINIGQTIGFKINTTSTNYQIAIYRLGFYGGAGARKIATLGPFTNAQTQPDCLTDSATGLIADSPTGLVDCSNWSITASWNTTGATSGIYLAKLTRLDVTPNTSSHIVFVVRDDARDADILFQTSDTTWQAYNQWGGGSLYCGGPVSNAGTAYRCTGRAVKVSYNRPLDTRAHDPQSFLFNAEYPMVRWLEANGYDVKYWSGVDSDRFGTDLTGIHKPKTFLSVGHDEYWSANQRLRVEQARNAGVNLAFFSGNEMFWKTRWEPGLDAVRTPYRTLVSYKETLRNATNNDPLDPLDTGATPISTATWRDTRFGPPADAGRPENAVTGQFWTVNCCTSDIEVPAQMKDLRFWRNTRIATLAPNTVATLSTESLGYEWDEDLDNGSRPNGLVHLSSTTRSVNEKILDFGTTVGPGTATHSLTLYRHSSDALVFGAGTVQWSWGLDGDHDRGDLPGSHQPDHAMQQATINLLADMNAQPATLQIGADPNRPLVRGVKSTDISGPSSGITAPVSGTTVRAGARVLITGTAVDTGGAVAGVEVSVDGGTTWKLAQGTTSWVLNWSPGTVGPTTIRSRAIDDSGNIEAAGPSVTIGVEPGNCPCTSLWPATTVPPVPDFNDATALELGVKFKSDIDGFITGVRYYKSAGNGGTHIGNLWTTSGIRLATATFTGETATGWQQVNFPTPVAITANTIYIASYHTDVGHYAAASDYFLNASVDSPPLHALTSLDAGGNGVFLPSITSGFPNQTFRTTNYWVDVVFSPTIQDTTPPAIFDVRQTTIDSSRATISWATDESATSRVEYSTDATLPAAQTVTVSNGTFVTAHQVGLTGLTPNTTYFYRVTSIDRAGNSGSLVAPSFTVPGPTLRDTAQADFAAGQSTGTYAAQTDDGELILAPTVGAEFAGTALPAGWSAVQWNAGGTAVVRDGLLTVDGVRVGVCANDANGNCTIEATPYGPGHSLEFVAQFGGDTFEHAGFGMTLGSTTEPWAIFSTFTGGGLYARTNTGVTSVDQLLAGNFIGTPHRYRIDWNADGSVTYFIDGVQVAAHTAKILANMRPIAASDLATLGATVSVDWIRMTPYAASGTFLSRVFDATTSVFWNSIQWTAKTPAGTTVAISLRTGDTPTPDATWSAFVPVPAPGVLTQHSRFIQYRAVLTSNASGVTPRLDDIIISTSHIPTPQGDAVSLPMNGSIVFPASGPGSLTFNDTDADPTDVLHVIGVTQPLHGVTLLNGDGSVTYAPTLNYQGPDSFVYTVTDGLLTATATVSITVRAANVAPVANPDLYTVNEDTTLTVAAAAGVLANDTDADGNTLTAVLVTLPAHGALALAANGSFTYTPAPNYAGPDTFTYKANDGTDNSNVASVQITINQVNDAPTFVKGPDQIVLEDSGPQSVIGWATAISAGPADEAAQTLTFTVTNDNAALFAAAPALSPTGVLTFTPAANASGSSTVTVTLQDNGGTLNGGVNSSAQTFVITVKPVNDAPTFIKGADQTVLEDAGAQSVPGWATAISAGPPSEAAQTLSFTATASNTALFSVQPALTATGTLSYTPAPNANGSSTVTVVLKDSGGILDGGVDTSASQTFTITVTPVNDAPSFVKGLDQTVLEDAGAQAVPGWATSISAGPANESAQLLTFTATNSNNALFSAQPAIAATGTLTFTPAPNANGSAIVTVTLKDDGGIANGGVNASAPQTFTITVTAVNDAPVASGQSVSTAEDTAKVITLAATDVDGDPLTYTIATAPAHGTLSGTAPALTYTPAPDYNGTDSFTFTASDPSNAASNVATVSIAITPVNDPPVAVSDNKSVRTGKTLTFPATDLTANDSPGPIDESSQILTVTGVSITTNGTVSLINGTVTFTPATGYIGPASFGYTVCDNGTTNGVANAKCASGSVNVTVLPPNVVPTVQPITWTSPTSVDGVKVGTLVNSTATFMDTAGELHTAVWSWGDGTTSVGTVNEATRVVTGSHTYTTPKLYTVTLTVTDGDGASGTTVFQYVVVYNPLAGSETGAGTINAPAGSVIANPTLAGTASINLTAKYGLDGTLATFGNLFQFNHAFARISFNSSSMRWLVMSGGQSWLKGEGTGVVNGVSEIDCFLLSVVDSTTTADKVRVKIWNKATGKVIFDNQAGAPDDALATVAAPTGALTITFK